MFKILSNKKITYIIDIIQSKLNRDIISIQNNMKNNKNNYLKTIILLFAVIILFISCPNTDMRDLVELKVSDPVADTFIINAGAATSSLEVTLNSDVTKEEDVLEMRFKNADGSWSEWETYSSAKTWNLSPGDGFKTVYAQYRDEGHHVVEMENIIELNTGAPAGDFYIWGTAVSGNQHEYTNTANVTLCMNIINVEKMRFSNDNLTWSEDMDYSPTAEWTLPAGDGPKTVYASFTTNAGTTTTSTNSTASGNPPVLDTTAPAVSNFLINSGDADVNNIGATLSYNFTEANTAWAEYRNDGGSWSSQEAVSGSSASKSWVLKAETGTRTVYARLSDIAGNISSVYSDDIYLNTAAPAAPVVTAVTPVQTMHPTWTWNSVPGAVSYKYSLDGSPWGDNGTATSYTPTTALMYNMSHTLEVTAVDSEGRESEVGSATVYIDTEGPAVSGFYFYDLLGKRGDTISMDFSVTDVSGISGIPVVKIGDLTANTTYNTNYTTQYTVTSGSPSGTFDLVITVTDNAGNTTERIMQNLVTIDAISPVINSFSINNGNTYSCSPVLQAAMDISDNMTSNGDLLIRLNGNSYLPPYEVYSAEGVVTLSVRDGAGNTSSDSDSIIRKSGTDDIRFENQSHPSNSGSYAYDLGNMYDYVDGGDHAAGSTQSLPAVGGAKSLWDEDWYKIVIDQGTQPSFSVRDADGSGTSALKIEVYYDENGTVPAPLAGTGQTDVLLSEDDFYNNPQTVWIKVYKAPAETEYTGVQYYLDWWIGYM